MLSDTLPSATTFAGFGSASGVRAGTGVFVTVGALVATGFFVVAGAFVVVGFLVAFAAAFFFLTVTLAFNTFLTVFLPFLYLTVAVTVVLPAFMPLILPDLLTFAIFLFLDFHVTFAFFGLFLMVTFLEEPALTTIDLLLSFGAFAFAFAADAIVDTPSKDNIIASARIHTTALLINLFRIIIPPLFLQFKNPASSALCRTPQDSL